MKSMAWYDGEIGNNNNLGKKNSFEIYKKQTGKGM